MSTFSGSTTGAAGLGFLAGVVGTQEKLRQAQTERDKEALKFVQGLLKEGWKPVDKSSATSEAVVVPSLRMVLRPPKIDREAEFKLRMKELGTRLRGGELQAELTRERLESEQALQEGRITEAQHRARIKKIELQIKQTQLEKEKSGAVKTRTTTMYDKSNNPVPVVLINNVPHKTVDDKHIKMSKEEYGELRPSPTYIDVTRKTDDGKTHSFKVSRHEFETSPLGLARGTMTDKPRIEKEMPIKLAQLLTKITYDKDGNIINEPSTEFLKLVKETAKEYPGWEVVVVELPETDTELWDGLSDQDRRVVPVVVREGTSKEEFLRILLRKLIEEYGADDEASANFQIKKRIIR